jgi:hypothetical protein
MSDKRAARFLQDTTGASYSTCLRKVQRMRASPNAEEYFKRVMVASGDGLSSMPMERPLCVDCLKTYGKGHRCAS